MDNQKKLTDWQVPAFESTPAQRQGWVEEAVQEGETWWDHQVASSSERDLDLLSCKGPEKLKSNSVKSDIRKFVETISDIREIATYAGAEQFNDYVQLFNDVVKFVYSDSYFPRQSRQALQFAVGLGRGYLWPRYIRSDFGWGAGGVEFVALGPREVLPCQLPRSNDMQGAYVQTIVECMGIAEAHARFPWAQEMLQPISKFKYSSNAQVRRHEFWDKWKYGQDSQDWDRRYCEIRYTFVRDLRINRTGKMLPMGDLNTSWYYEVPSVGSVMSWIDPNNGLPASKQAKPEDCRVYPQLRLVISNPGMSSPLYDGPAFDWHGMMPAVQYDVDDWPWLAVGYSLLYDIAGVERARRGFLDLIYRVLRRKMDPPLGYDLDAGVPREDIKNFDWLDSDNFKMGVSGNAANSLVSLLPDSINVTEEDFRMLDVFEKQFQKTLGLNDLSSLAQLKFNLSDANFDKILETIGPIAKGISGNIQVAQSKIACMLKFIIPQYFTTRRMMSIVGPDGVAAKVFDYRPNSLVPSHMDWEKKKDDESDSPLPSSFSDVQRAKWLAENLVVKSVPSQLMNITQMQEKMMYMNALQRGWPVSFSTAFKKIGIEWSETDGATEFDKYKSEQFDLLKMKVEAAQIAQFESQPTGGAPGGPGAPGAPPTPAPPAGPSGHGGGRPPSGQEPPKLETRGSQSGNIRTTISQSK
jgi:hypothetical protein